MCYLSGFDHALSELVNVLGVSIFAQRDRRVRAYDFVVVPAGDVHRKKPRTGIPILEKIKRRQAAVKKQRLRRRCLQITAISLQHSSPLGNSMLCLGVTLRRLVGIPKNKTRTVLSFEWDSTHGAVPVGVNHDRKTRRSGFMGWLVYQLSLTPFVRVGRTPKCLGEKTL